jgi:hypothetical protein
MKNLVILLTVILSLGVFAQDVNVLIDEHNVAVVNLETHSKTAPKANASAAEKNLYKLQSQVYQNDLELSELAIIKGQASESYIVLKEKQDAEFDELAAEILQIQIDLVDNVVSIDDVSKVEVCESCKNQDVDNTDPVIATTLADKIRDVQCENHGWFPKPSFRTKELTRDNKGNITSSTDLYKFHRGVMTKMNAKDVPYKESFNSAKTDNGSLIIFDGEGHNRVHYVSMCTYYKRGKNGLKTLTDSELRSFNYQSYGDANKGLRGTATFTIFQQTDRKDNTVVWRERMVNKCFTPINL